MSTQAMNKIRKKQDGNTDTSDGTAINNMGILVSNFATPEQVYRHFSAHHQSHILAITSTGLIRDKMSVFMVVFNSIASAKGAFGSINSEAHKFRRCYTDLDLAIHAHISNDECQVPKSDAIQSRPLNTRKRKAETLSNSYLTEAAVEIVEADGFVSPLSKRQRRESAPSPVSLPSKDIPSDSANDLTQVKSDALKGLCKVVAEKLTPYTLSRVRHDLASSNASEAALTLSRQQVDVIRSLCKLALRPNSAKQGAPPATLTSVPKMFANQIPLGPKKPWKTEKEEARIQKIKPQERSQELCTEFPEYASSIPNELGTKRATLLKSILRLLVLHPSTQLPQLKTTSKMQEFLKNLSAKRVQNLGIVDINRKPETRESILEQLRKTYPEFARHVPDSISKGQASEMERIFILLRQCPKPLMPERFDQDTEKKLREAVNQTRLQRLVKNKRNKKSKSPHIKKEPVDVSSTPHKLQAVLPGPPFRAHGFAQ